MKKIFLKLLILLLFLVGCQSPVVQDLSDFDELLQYKKPFLLPTESLDLEITSPSEEELEKLAEFREPRNVELKTSKKLIREDLQDLKWMLETAYSRYPLFDKEFEAAFEAIIDEVPATGSDRGSLAALMRKHFLFNRDYHFTIDGHYTNIRLPNVYDLDNSYHLEGNVATHTETKEILDTTEFLEPFLLEDGEVVYKQVNRTNVKSPYSEYYVKAESLNLEVPYFHFNDFETQSLDFNRFATRIRNEKIAVIDLRNNSGGDQFYPASWITLLTGRKIKHSFGGYMRQSPQSSNYVVNGLIVAYLAGVPRDGYYEFKPSEKVLPHSGLLIVLQNSETVSAGELLIDYLHHVENTLFIGTPTKGSLSSNIVEGPVYLKNTGIGITFGNMATLFNPNYFKEEVGFSPDLYVLDKDMQSVIESLLMKLSTE